MGACGSIEACAEAAGATPVPSAIMASATVTNIAMRLTSTTSSVLGDPAGHPYLNPYPEIRRCARPGTPVLFLSPPLSNARGRSSGVASALRVGKSVRVLYLADYDPAGILRLRGVGAPPHFSEEGASINDILISVRYLCV